ncbi:hypothetical protein M4P98_000681 [Campylobacter upsaliensis]|uniref:hypothetical protein n=1 Tax=Campylobacter upsaliensis TaxID=28080 RepID=UPI0012876053|nr:hypothetical protein [Campylobacter upsaliensis]EFO9429310.1 hypothetical protein [Campylobacter upsaliensis]EGI5172596.1 hypothetical protein [Campylobacter upsaliensis]EGK1134837.1 hypothetical protein [Campylobacter upsaliensis]EJE0942338.1 hypothetical protein [Campylobacter upsaliensis]ELB7664825.1 hypothetical protein [Campylobacter upsaliensis]
MKNTLMIFENSLSNLSPENVKEILEDLSFNLVYKQENQKANALNELLLGFLDILKKLGLFDEENVTKVIKAMVRASTKDAQNSLYALIAEAERLEGQIENYKISLKNQISHHFLEFEKILQESNFKNEFSKGLDGAILFDIEMLGILKETAESAFLTTLEKGEDIELTSEEIAKNLVYNAIFESHFEKERILQISSLVLNVVFELANESIVFAKDLVLGAVRGVSDGISLGIEKFKNSLTFIEFEEEIRLKSKELIGIEDDFVSLLKTEAKKQKNPSKELIERLIEEEFDSIFAKLKRFANENREQINFFLVELKKNPKINDFNEFAQRKMGNLNANFLKLEKRTSEKYKNLNIKKAKNLGFRLWERAKKFIHKKN